MLTGTWGPKPRLFFPTGSKISDIDIPPRRPFHFHRRHDHTAGQVGHSQSAENKVNEIGRQYTEGLITQGEKYNKVVDIWAKATDDVANEMMDSMRTNRFWMTKAARHG